ncbi:MAG: hypothetical protein C4575_14020 [Desulforudis sp.]|nr:MAG: hypothetical protein C4575_14020 [Desulforudis sp.]
MVSLAAEYKKFLDEKLNPTLGPAQYAVYNYCEDFVKFWPVETEESKSSGCIPEVIIKTGESGKRALLIVWEKMPEDDGPAKLAPHLTPLDWVLAYSTRALRDGNAALQPMSIHIIDLSSTNYESTFSMQMAASTCEAMPWVKLYAPIPRGRKAYESKFPAQELETGCWPDAVVTLPSISGGNALSRLKNLNHAWQAWVVQSSDHHDLNNRIGPQIILEILSAERISSPINELDRAMITRLKWCGLLQNQNTEIPGGDKQAPVLEKTDILVVDDQLARGWDQVLCSLIGVDYQKTEDTTSEPVVLGTSVAQEISIKGISDPVTLLYKKYLAKDVDDKELRELYLRRQFSFEKPTLLVLDLYLFSGRQVSDKQDWYKALASLALKIETLGANAKEKLAWPGFPEKEQLESIAETGSDDELHLDTALSLLPRLCALRWPSVPIIVFSATRRREIVAKLTDYGNIFLSSPKPNVLSVNATDQVSAFVENWNRDLRAAQGLLKVQQEIINLCRDVSCPTAESNSKSNNAHVIIAFDEMGNFKYNVRSAIGGVILVCWGDDEDGAISNSYRAQEFLRENGVNFYNKAPYYPDARIVGKEIDSIIGKKSNISGKLKRLNESFQGDVALSTFCLWLDGKNYASDNDFFDGAYLHGLEICVELIVCELLPCIKGSKTFTWWFPAKMANHWDDREANKAKDDAYHRIMRETGDSKKATAESEKILEKMKANDLPESTKKAKISARRFDFRYVTESRTETVGSGGHAYSMVAKALNKRKGAEPVIGNTKIFRSRKIPYGLCNGINNNQHIHWQCPLCVNEPPFLDLHKSTTRICSKCRTEMIAEYSVLGHLADAVLPSRGIYDTHVQFPSGNTGKDAFFADYCFELEDNSQLFDFVHVSRLLDANRKADALKLAYKNYGNPFFKKGLMKSGSFAKADLQRRVRDELRNIAPYLSGNDIIELAGLPIRYINPSQSAAPIKTGQITGKSSKPKGAVGKGPQAPRQAAGKPQEGQKDNHDPAKYRGVITGFANEASGREIIKASVRKLLGIDVEIEAGISNTGRPKLTFDIITSDKSILAQSIKDAFIAAHEHRVNLTLNRVAQAQ